MKPSPSQPEDDQIDSRMPLWAAVFANSLSLAYTLQFFGLRPDDCIRPLMWIVFIFVIGVGTLFVLPLVLFNLKRLRGRTWPKYAIVLCLTPIPLAVLVEKIA